MAKETQNLVDLVQPQRGLALLQIADKPQPHSSPIGKIMLGHSHGFALGFYKLNQWIIHLKYPIEYKFISNTFYYTRKGSSIVIFRIINPIEYKTGCAAMA
jgi:hypothetical protein